MVFKKDLIHFTASALKQRRLEKSPKSPQLERVTVKEAYILCVEVRKGLQTGTLKNLWTPLRFMEYFSTKTGIFQCVPEYLVIYLHFTQEKGGTRE